MITYHNNPNIVIAPCGLGFHKGDFYVDDTGLIRGYIGTGTGDMTKAEYDIHIVWSVIGF